MVTGSEIIGRNWTVFLEMLKDEMKNAPFTFVNGA
jgi:hypothetical protein